VYDAQFTADGRHVALQTADGVLRVWRVDQPAHPERVLEGHRGAMYSLNQGADGRIVTAGADGTVRVWARRGSHSVVLVGHTNAVTGAAFTADASMVLSTSQDGTLRLWNSRSDGPSARLARFDHELDHLAVSRDGNIAYLDTDHYIRVMKCTVCGTLPEVEALARSLHPRQLTADERDRYEITAD